MADYESNEQAAEVFLNDDQQYCTFLLEKLLFGVQVDRVQEFYALSPSLECLWHLQAQADF